MTSTNPGTLPASAADRQVSVLVVSGSQRAHSLNTRLAELAAATLSGHGVDAQLATLSEFDAPGYNQDVQDSSGIPPGPAKLRQRLLAADAFIIASPEYNASMPGALKNVIDWVSRYRPQPFHERQGLLMSASPSMVGGNRGAWALRVPLEHLGARIYPDMFSLAQAHEAFDTAGNLVDPRLDQHFQATLLGFMDLVEASKHYPCMKTAWVEYLGERLGPQTSRIDEPA